MKIVDFLEMRTDWYAGADLMARALQRQLRFDGECIAFVRFPRHWIPLFEWAGARWRQSTDPDHYVPLISGMSEAQVLDEVARARREGQLRLLVEAIASCDTVLCETLQRMDTRRGASLIATPGVAKSSRNFLTNWHSYTRPELGEYEDALSDFRPLSKSAVFLSCGRARPYLKSRTHYRIRQRLIAEGVDIDGHDVIVITSIGPVPQCLWHHPVVMRYDTGVRDIYRILVLLRRLLNSSRYEVAWDCLSFQPYRDVLQIVANEGRIGTLARPDGMRSRNVPTYRHRATRHA